MRENHGRKSSIREIGKNLGYKKKETIYRAYCISGKFLYLSFQDLEFPNFMVAFSLELFGYSRMATALYMDGRGRTIDRRREFEAEARHELFRENRLCKP